MATKKLTQDSLIEVYNTSSGSVGYTPEMSTVAKKWERQGVMKKVKLGEIRDVVSTSGGYTIFEENILLIKDATAREELGLSPLDGYTLTLPEIKELLSAGSLEKLTDIVQCCTQDMLDTIVDTAINTRLADLNKIRVIEEYTGVDLVGAIKEKHEEQPKEVSTAKVTADKPKRKPKAKAE